MQKKYYPKCQVHNKDSFPTEAVTKAEVILRKLDREITRVYHCHFCNGYHTTSKPRTDSSQVFPIIAALTEEGKAKLIKEIDPKIGEYEVELNGATYEYTYFRNTRYVKVKRKTQRKVVTA